MYVLSVLDQKKKISSIHKERKYKDGGVEYKGNQAHTARH